MTLSTFLFLVFSFGWRIAPAVLGICLFTAAAWIIGTYLDEEQNGR